MRSSIDTVIAGRGKVETGADISDGEGRKYQVGFDSIHVAPGLRVGVSYRCEMGRRKGSNAVAEVFPPFPAGGRIAATEGKGLDIL